jgi:hypothetical protein
VLVSRRPRALETDARRLVEREGDEDTGADRRQQARSARPRSTRRAAGRPATVAATSAPSVAASAGDGFDRGLYTPASRAVAETLDARPAGALL